VGHVSDRDPAPGFFHVDALVFGVLAGSGAFAQAGDVGYSGNSKFREEADAEHPVGLEATGGKGVRVVAPDLRHMKEMFLIVEARFIPAADTEFLKGYGRRVGEAFDAGRRFGDI
jgi:hypothetical protein